MTTLSRAEATRPIDWVIPHRLQAVRKMPAVYSAAACMITPQTADAPTRTATAICNAAGDRSTS